MYHEEGKNLNAKIGWERPGKTRKGPYLKKSCLKSKREPLLSQLLDQNKTLNWPQEKINQELSNQGPLFDLTEGSCGAFA